jgi:hypothetical protein
MRSLSRVKHDGHSVIAASNKLQASKRLRVAMLPRDTPSLSRIYLQIIPLFEQILQTDAIDRCITISLLNGSIYRPQ